MSSASGLPPDSKLGPGAPRGAVGAPGGPPPRNTDNDIWAADIHMTPNGKFLYISERTVQHAGGVQRRRAQPASSRISAARPPRSSRADSRSIPKGRFLVASGEKSDTISVYAIDQSSGALKLLQKYPTGKGSNWVEIVSFD